MTEPNIYNFYLFYDNFLSVGCDKVVSGKCPALQLARQKGLDWYCTDTVPTSDNHAQTIHISSSMHTPADFPKLKNDMVRACVLCNNMKKVH